MYILHVDFTIEQHNKLFLARAFVCQRGFLCNRIILDAVHTLHGKFKKLLVSR